MFQNIPTSKIIAIKFSVYVTGTLILFVLIANSLFFREWYHGETKRLFTKESAIPNIPFANGTIVGSTDVVRGGSVIATATATAQGPFDRPGKFMRTIVETFPYSENLDNFLQNRKIFRNISMLDDEYVLFASVDGTMKIVVVTRQIEAQKNMLYISLLSILFFGLLTYSLSHYFVKSSLYRLENLRKAVTDLHIDSLDIQLPLEWPETDEVRIIWTKLQESLNTVKKQTSALKNFVGNVSHELKTPLMQIGWHIDYMIKAQKDYTEWLWKIKKTTKSMSNIIESMLLLMKLETQDMSWVDNIDISQITNTVLERVSASYKSKNIKLIPQITPEVMKYILPQHYDIVLQNLLTNAYKYTDSGTIRVTLTETQLIIKDTGKGIQPENVEKIWEKFRQEDRSKSDDASYGLGLAIVKKITDVYNWDVSVTSAPISDTQDDTSWWTTFTITMKA